VDAFSVLVGMVSDLHSNLPALRAVLGRMRRLGVSRIICAGDLVGYYTFPNEVVGLAGKASIHSIAGNHDRAVVSGDHSNLNELASLAARWTAGRLSAESLERLRRLKPRDRLELGGRRMLLVHGSPRDDNEYVFPSTPGNWPFRDLDVEVLVMGLTHVQWQYRFGRTLVINPGSVGQPRDGDPRAAYALFSEEEGLLRYRRVRYDVEAAQAKIRAAGLPPSLADRLAEGK
jgi:putative phosphoesterase